MSTTFAEQTFSIRSGRFAVDEGVTVARVSYGRPYDTVANGSTCAVHITVICRDTGKRDRQGLAIYEDQNEVPFVFDHRRGTPDSFASGVLREPM
jgi:hypothetical protein